MEENNVKPTNRRQYKEFKRDTVLTKADIQKFKGMNTWFIRFLLNLPEKYFANALLRKYLGMFDPVHFGEFELIQGLVHEQTMLFRMEKMMKNNDHPSHVLMETICRQARRIDELKIRLGVFPKEVN